MKPTHGPKTTTKLCNEPKDPGSSRSPRCILPKGHEGTAHEAISADGRRLEWPQR
jgi:hypothetical protein